VLGQKKGLRSHRILRPHDDKAWEGVKQVVCRVGRLESSCKLCLYRFLGRGTQELLWQSYGSWSAES